MSKDARRKCFHDKTFIGLLNEETRRTRRTHAGLWFDKYLLEQEEKKRQGGDQKEPALKDDKQYRHELVKEVCTLPEPAMYQSFFDRWKAMLREEHNAEMRCARVKGRMIVGLGLESVIETAVLLHRTYGVPYIPGSALKGLAASYVRQHLGEDWQKGSSQYKILFGDTDDAGYITFFDALYVPGTGHNEQALWPDIIAVHHPQYYQGEAAPADWDSPIPVPLLSATGKYLVALAAPDLQQRKQWLDLAFQSLGQALGELGIGAKTSSGYGRMEFVDCETVSTQEEPQSQEEGRRISPEARQCIEKIHQIPKPIFNQRIFDAYKEWQGFNAPEDRLAIALAIVERIDQEGYREAKSKKSWYQELVAFIATATEKQ